MYRFVLLSLLLGLILGGCQSQKGEKGNMSGTLFLADTVQLPFRMHLDLTSSPHSAYFIVGDQMHPIPEIQYEGDSLKFIFSEYGSAMLGILEDHSFIGNYYKYRKDTTILPFSASYESVSEPPPVSETKTFSIRLKGNYQAYFLRGEVIDSSSIGTFRVNGDSVQGTFFAPDGDFGLLAGIQKGDNVRLSRFTGWQVMMVDLRLSRSRWSGLYYSFKSTPVLLTLVPLTTSPKTAEAASSTKMKNPDKPFSFSGISSSGEAITNNDERFKGKALIIDLMGTWCHNCNDAAPVLQEIFLEYKDRGLEVVSLAFEMKDDFEKAKKNFSLFAKRHKITYPILFCGSTAKENVEQKIRQHLDNFLGYPTALFIDRNGKVQHVRVGFNGPGTGDEYAREIELLKKYTEHILQ
jgi:thiol-disulfide isomerase/thioredoxin